MKMEVFSDIETFRGLDIRRLARGMRKVEEELETTGTSQVWIDRPSYWGEYKQSSATITSATRINITQWHGCSEQEQKN